MKDEQNIKWTMRDIAQQYKYENPEWSWKKCWTKARVIYKELMSMNNKMWNDNKKYFKNNTPFSFFESEDGKLSSIPELDDI